MAQVDSLEISIQSNIDKVNKNLDALIGKLGDVAKGISAIKNNKGLEEFAEEAKNISTSLKNLGKEAAQSMKGVETQAKKATKTIREIVEEANKSTMNLMPELNMGNLDAEARKYENQLRNMQNRLSKILAMPSAEKRSATIESLVAGINEAENALKKIEEIKTEVPEINIKINSGEAERTLSDFMKDLDNFKEEMKSTEEVYGSLENIPVGGLDIAISNLKQDLEELRTSFPKAKNEISAYENMLKQLQEISGKLTVAPKIEKIDTSAIDNAANNVREKIKELQQQYEDVGKDFYFEGNAEQLEAEINKLNIDLEKLYAKRDKKIDLGEIDTKPFRDIMYEIQSVINKLDILEAARPEALNKTLEENAEKARNAANQLKQFEANLQQLRVPPVNEENLTKLQNALKKAEENLAKLQTKLANGLTLGKITESIDDSGYLNLREQIALTEKTIEALNSKIQEVGANTQNANEAASSSTGYSRMTNILNTVANAANKLSNMLIKLVASMKKFASSVANFVSSGINKLSTGIKNAASGAAKLTKSLLGVIGANKKSNASFGTSLKTILKYTIGIRSLYTLFNKLRSAIKDGMQNLIQFSNTVNHSVSTMYSGLYSLKNALAAAFAPIVNVIAPYIANFTNMMIDAANAVGRFFAALTGKSYAIQAKKVYIDLAKAAKDAAKAVGTIGIDELNILSDQKDEELLPEDMFEWVEVEKDIADWASKIRDAFLNQDWEGLGKAIAELMNKGLRKLYDAIKNITPKVEQALKNLAKVLNSFIDNLDWDLLGRTIGAGINLLTKAFNALFGDDGIDLENLGRKLSVALRGMIDEVNWRELGNAIGNYLMIAWRIAYGFIEDMWRIDPNTLLTGWAEAGIAIGETIAGIFERIDFEKIATVITEGFKGILETITYALNTFSDNLDWIVGKINLGLDRLYDGLKWDSTAGENMGQKITALTDAISTAFNKLLNLDFGKVGQIIGAAITDIVRAFNQLTDISGGMDFEKLGTKLSNGLRGLITEIPWDEFGNALGNGFMIAWRTLDGFLTDMAKKSNAGLTGWQELGNAISGTINGLFEKFDLSKVADSIARLINGMFSMLKQTTENMKWDEIADNISNGLNTLIHGIQWKENGETFNKLMQSLLDMILRAAKNTDWKALGKGIGEFLGQIDWKGIFNNVFEIIKETIGGLIDGLNDTVSGKIGLSIAAFVASFKALNEILPIITALFGPKGAIIAGILALIPAMAVGGKDLAKTIGDFVKGILDKFLEVVRNIDWGEVGRNIIGFIAQTLSDLPEIMGKIAAVGIELIGHLVAGLIEGILTTNWLEIGANLIAGLVKGVAAMVGALLEIPKMIFEAIVNGIKNLFGIHSPSTVMAEIGGYIMQGLIDGIKSLFGIIEGIFDGIVETIIEIWSGVGETLKSIWQNIKTSAEEIWNGIKEFFSNIWDGIKEKTEEVWNGIKTFFSEIWQTIKDVAINIWTEIKEFFISIWDGILEFVQNIWTEIQTFLSETWENIKENAIEIWESIKEFFINVWNGVKETAENVWNEIKNTLIEIWNNVKDKAIEIWNAIEEFFQNLWKNIKEKTEEIWDSIKGFLENTWNEISNIASNIWNAIKDFIINVWGGVSNKFHEVWEEIKGFLSEIWNLIKDKALEIWNSIKDFFVELWNDIKEKFESTWNEIKNTLIDIWNNVKDKAIEIWNAIKEFFKGTWENFKEDSEKAWENVKSVLFGTWENIKNTAEKVWGDIKGFFMGIWDGVGEGIGQAFEAAIEVIKNAWNSFAEWLNSKLSFEIPSISIMGKQLFGGTTIDLGKIPTFSTGGFPEDGLFYKNSNEMITQVAGKTQVLNSSDTYDMIKQAAYEGQMQAQQELISYLSDIARNTRETADKDMSVRIGDRDIVDSYRRGSERMGFVF